MNDTDCDTVTHANYFGAAARERFFHLFQTIDRQAGDVADIIAFQASQADFKDLEMVLEDDELAEDRQCREAGLMATTYSPRQEYVRRLVCGRKVPS